MRKCPGLAAVEIEEGRVDIRADNGDIVNPRVSVGDDYVEYLRTVPEDSMLSISTVKGAKNITLDGAPSNFYERGSVFFQLPVGRHSITISAQAGLEYAVGAIVYRLKYLGV